jgi:hypothetical protein
MEHESLVIFSWGYWGWGTATGQFVSAVGAVEKARGFEPPMFVDTRIRRSVRAPGFNGSAFERTVGPALHRWMPSLGNLAVLDGSEGIRIKDPGAAADLLDLALECCPQRRRILFFCSCEYPGHEGLNGCHRTAVARLVLEEAQRRSIGLHVQEWPGGEPSHDLRIGVPSDAVKRMERGAKSIRLPEAVSLSVVAGIPWCSDVEVVPGSDETSSRRVLTGPAKYSKHDGWWLPIIGGTMDSHASLAELRRQARELRARQGLDVRSV